MRFCGGGLQRWMGLDAYKRPFTMAHRPLLTLTNFFPPPHRRENIDFNRIALAFGYRYFRLGGLDTRVMSSMADGGKYKSELKDAGATTMQLEKQLGLKLSKEFNKYEFEGVVTSIRDGSADVFGLYKAHPYEIVHFEGCDVAGVVLSLETDLTRVGLLGTASKTGLCDGARAYLKRKNEDKEVLTFPSGRSLGGKVVDALGNPIPQFGNHVVQESVRLPVLNPRKTSLTDRSKIDKQLWTGIKALDVAYPIGYGQRVALIGEVGLGKRKLACNILRNMRHDIRMSRCVWVSVGRDAGVFSNIVRDLRDQGVLEYTTVIGALQSDPWMLQYIAPYCGVALGEEEMMKPGHHTLIVFDGLSAHGETHAKLANFQGLSSGARLSTQSQPHAELMERAYKSIATGSSITSIAIFDTDDTITSDRMIDHVNGVVDMVIPFDVELNRQGMFPPVKCFEIGKGSLPRHQIKQQSLSQSIKELRQRMYELSQIEEGSRLAHSFGIDMASEMDVEHHLDHAKRLRWMFHQDPGTYLPKLDTLLELLYANNGLLAKGTVDGPENVVRQLEKMRERFKCENESIYEQSRKHFQVFDDPLPESLMNSIERFLKNNMD